VAVKGFLKGLGARPVDGQSMVSTSAVAISGPARLTLLDDFESLGIGWLWATDAEGRLTYISSKLAELLGFPADHFLSRSMADLFETDPDSQGERSSRPLRFLFGTQHKITDATVRLKKTNRNPDEPHLWLSMTGQPKMDSEGNFHGYRGSFKDVTEEYRLEVESSRLAEYDSLTGLANRHRMEKRIDSYLSAFAAAKRSCALLMLDLDRFKQVNDTMGHPAGDELLRQVAGRLRGIIGDRGEVGRLGGDEFQIILPDQDDNGKLGELADKIVQIISQPYPIDDKRAVIGTSVGIAIAPYDGIDRDQLVRSADLALYASKKGGRGQYRFYSADLKDEKEERQILLNDLRDALVNEQLELHYQPVVRADDNFVVGFEALMRWEHPERGRINPDTFIAIAEESNLINQLGEWALRKACAQALEWPENIRIAVNVSAMQFANSNFPGIVMNALAATGLSPDRLELELTESVFMGDSETVDETFKVLKELGIRLVLDDFGTGFSSLSYLRYAPFDKIKVDKSFVETCTLKEQNSSKIIAAIIGLSDAIGMETTIEGVEAFDQLELVRSKGARLIQGWIYSKALPPEDIRIQMGSGNFKIEPDGPEQHRPERRTVFRRVGVIHDDHRYEAIMRNLSKSGALIEGLLGVPCGTEMVLDLSGGQLAVCTVIRSEDALVGLKFETPLVNDGAGGLRTRHRVSPYALAAAGMPLAALPAGSYPLQKNPNGPSSPPHFAQVSVANA